ncbi:zinc ABC transporter ATP-binding protein ZnuC [Zobellella denitrificans]|jgi:zinc transport system ATP-binding protein|uniref:Zinc ABC transporter ATPase n=1 Tax=Zobellella denitrificans TaxID=347534 RepID=A0A231N0Y6_9GAMM|nr:zinc ABC transporter ATP-binding protein ZnuC [Zobellella denitrificans]ATG72999.1 zinc ABC transporter ATPase [Zobellella denitrificans]OXS15885.1 zinc ABC transporter ATP-binding protein ZnuC [Zobellella denitrificans]
MTKLVELTDVGLEADGNIILERISLTLHRGEILTIVGPNGAGKSSLVKLVLRLCEASRGQLWRKPGLRIGYVPQKLHLDPVLPLTVARFMSLSHGRRLSVAQALARVGAERLAERSMQALSGGEMQRILLARALMMEPELLILDEPAQGVDVHGQTELYALIKQLSDQLHCGVLMVSHDLHLVMASTHRVICLNQHICCHGEPEHVARHPEFARLFGRPELTQLAVYTHHHACDDEHHGDVRHVG